MNFLEIIVIIIVIFFFLGIISIYIYKRVNNKPIGECSCCSSRMKNSLKKGIESIQKELEK